MANHDQPKTNMQPDQPKLIPVRTLNFHPGLNLTIPGKDVTTNSLTGDAEVGPGKCFKIAHDPRLRSFRVEMYMPAPDPARAPTKVIMVSESVVCTWVPA